MKISGAFTIRKGDFSDLFLSLDIRSQNCPLAYSLFATAFFLFCNDLLYHVGDHLANDQTDTDHIVDLHQDVGRAVDFQGSPQ